MSEPTEIPRGYPPPYPRGWYRAANSDQLNGKAAHALSALGHELIVFRGADGKATVKDAYCPHQGAHLGGARLEGGCVRCPFHHWKFNQDGALVDVPGLDKWPRARLGTWDTREVNGMVWFWFDPAAPHSAAEYEPEDLSDVASGELAFRGEKHWGEVRMHLIEFAENSVDFQHFEPVHGQMRVPWVGWRIPGIRIHHEAHWEVDPDRPYVTFFHDDAHLIVLGRELPRTGAKARITLFGPGGIVTFRFTLPDLGDIVMYQTHTPSAPLAQQVYFRWYADPRVPSALAWYVVGNWIAQWREDIAIWARKRYVPRPVLCALDGPVHPMRRWYAQFYEDEAAVTRRNHGRLTAR